MFSELKLQEPLLTSHDFYALPLAIIMNNKTAINWFYSNFIQWYTSRIPEEERTSFRVYYKQEFLEGYEPLDHVRIEPDVLVSGGNIIEVYKYLINSNQYIYDHVDYYYINSLNGGIHYTHDILIYGYNDNIKTLKAYTYAKGKLTKFDITYDEYAQAYNSEYRKEQCPVTVLLKLKNEEYKIDLLKIKWHLLDYIECVNTYYRENTNKSYLYKSTWGFDVYEEFFYMIKYDSDLDIYIQIPDIYCFWEHKKTMIDRLIFLNTYTEAKCTNEIIDESALGEKEANIVLNLSVKLNNKPSNKNSTIGSVQKHLINMANVERKAFEAYYKLNENVFNNIGG